MDSCEAGDPSFLQHRKLSGKYGPSRPLEANGSDKTRKHTFTSETEVTSGARDTLTRRLQSVHIALRVLLRPLQDSASLFISPVANYTTL